MSDQATFTLVADDPTLVVGAVGIKLVVVGAMLVVVGATSVAVGTTSVAVGATSVAVGATSIAVGATLVVDSATSVAVGATSEAVDAESAVDNATLVVGGAVLFGSVDDNTGKTESVLLFVMVLTLSQSVVSIVDGIGVAEGVSECSDSCHRTIIPSMWK